MDWISLALTGLKVALALLDYAKERRQFNAGHEAAVLEMGKQVMARTAEGKRLMEKVNAMGEGELDDLESQLTEPDPGKG